MKMNRKQNMLISYPLALVVCVSCSVKPKPDVAGEVEAVRTPSADMVAGIQVGISLNPVSIQNVCQYEGERFQTSNKCGGVTRELGKEYPSFQPSELKQWAIEINNAYGKKVAELGQSDEGPTINKDGRLRRLTHSKTISCAVGTLSIEDEQIAGLESRYRTGLFRKKGTYRTISRFANGTTFVMSDTLEDARSHSFKIFGVPGEKLVSNSPGTMDFVMNNAPVFIFKSPKSFYDFFTKIMAFPKDQNEKKEEFKKSFFLRSVVNVVPPKFNGVDLLKATSELTKSKPVELMDIDYYSGIAFNLGGNAVKYVLKSTLCDKNRETPDLSDIDRSKDNHLQTAMQKFKDGGIPACWDLMIQAQQDPWRQPVEDTTLIWDHREAPFKKVGTLKVRAQDILVNAEDSGRIDANSQKKLSACESMSFNPWRVPAEMRPLGDLAKMRGFAYAESLNRRHKFNVERKIYSGAQSYQEPTGTELD